MEAEVKARGSTTVGKEAGAAAGGDLKAGSPSTFALSLARGPFLLAPARLLEGWSNPWGGPSSVLGHTKA